MPGKRCRRANHRSARGNIELPDIRVRLDHPVFSIRDYGCGIPADVLPRIFDPYSTTKPDGSGTGPGDGICLVAKHGGRISAEFEPGEGTVLSVDLPASPRSACA